MRDKGYSSVKEGRRQRERQIRREQKAAESTQDQNDILVATVASSLVLENVTAACQLKDCISTGGWNKIIDSQVVSSNFKFTKNSRSSGGYSETLQGRLAVHSSNWVFV